VALDPLFGVNRKRLEAELAQAQSDLMAGKATVRAGSGEILIQSQTEISLRERIRMILAALNKLDPETYPLDQITPASATKIVFNSTASTS
jgi:hypothetical protein